MVLEGVVTNVTRFGAFVDVVVHQDGLVHISELSNKFIKDPSEAVKAGQIVKVKVLSADARTKRVSLSIKALLEGTGGSGAKQTGQARPAAGARPQSSRSNGAQSQQKPAAPRTPPPVQTMEDKIAALTARFQKR